MYLIVYEKLLTRSATLPFLFANEFECDIPRKDKRLLSFTEKSGRDGFFPATKGYSLKHEYLKGPSQPPPFWMTSKLLI